jgi:hypothetical protein
MWLETVERAESGIAAALAIYIDGNKKYSSNTK